MYADPQTSRNLSNRISSDRITLEIFAVITLSHIDLLASKLGKKASTILGAIHGSG